MGTIGNWFARRRQDHETLVLRTLYDHPNGLFPGDVHDLTKLRWSHIWRSLWRLTDKGLLTAEWEETTNRYPRRRYIPKHITYTAR